MENYDGIENAQRNSNGVYLPVGDHLLQINRCKKGSSRKGEEFSVVEMKVLRSSDPAFTQGTPASWMLMHKWDGYLGDLKNFIETAGASCLAQRNLPPSPIQVTGALCREVFGEQNPFAGVVIKVHAWPKRSQKTGRDFTVCDWEVTTPEVINAVMSALTFGTPPVPAPYATPPMTGAAPAAPAGAPSAAALYAAAQTPATAASPFAGLPQGSAAPTAPAAGSPFFGR